MRRIFRLIILLMLCSIGIVPRMLRAQQWNMIATFPSTVSAIYFLDGFGAPDTGFVGCASTAADSGIYRTTNGGVTWRPCANTTGLIIRDFTFKNADTGWAVASNTPVVLETTDAGKTWTQLTAPNGGTTIRYAAQTNTLFLSYPNGGDAQSSTDDGQTWSQINVPSVNGLAFSDGATGIWSSHGVFPIYHTSDGGLNWLPSDLTHHIFSPTSLGTSPSFFGASEFDDSCYLSTDGGVRWTYRGCFTGPALTYSGTSGCVQSHNGNLWTQSVSDGMFLSRDTGLTWIPLCGPSGQIDSRFYARGNTIFAASSIQLFEDLNGTIPPTPASLACAPDTFSIRAPRCGSGGVLATLALGGGCYLELDSVYLTENGQPAKDFTVDQLILPDPLGSIDFGIYYHDGGQPFDTAYLHLVWRAGGILRDSIVPVYGSVGGVPATVSLPTLSKIHAATCAAIDTAVLITSIACDTLDILAAYLTDTSLFHLNPLLLPLQLRPNTSLGIRLRGMFQHPGVYTDSLRITLRYGTAHTIKDTIVSITVHVSGITLPAVSDLTVRAANGCQPIDTVIRVENLHCNTGTLDSMSIGDPTVSQAAGSAFPILLPPDSSVPIRIRVYPPKSGSALSAITLHFDIDSTRFDTVIYVTVINKSDPNPHPILSQNKIVFGPSSLCFGKQAAFLYRNIQCDTMLLTRIQWSYPDSEFSFDPIIVPATLAPGETDTMLFHYKPTATRNANATLTLTFSLDGLTKDTTINVTGNGTDAATASLAPDTLAFPPIRKCDASMDSATFVNTSCDTLVISSMQDISPDGFDVVSPASWPVTIAPGDSIPIVLRFAPGMDGAFADSIDLKYHSKVSPGSFFIQRMKLAGTASTPFTPAKIGGANFSNIHLAPCSELDTSFTIRDLNFCDSISITSIISDSAGFLITPPTPLTLREDSSITFHLHFAPSEDTEQASIHIVGVHLDTIIPVSIFRARADSLSFTPSTAAAFTARSCRSVSQAFVLHGGGLCDSMEIDSLLLSTSVGAGNGTKFSLSGVGSTPFILHGSDTIVVTYDPNRAGLDSAELIVTSSDGRLDLHLPLVGSIASPTPVAQCGIALDGKSRDTVSAGGVATLALNAFDAIPDSLGLADVSFDLNYDDNLLTKLPVIHPGPGFTTGTVGSATGSLMLQFLRAGHAPIAAGDPIGSVDFFVTIGDTLSTPIALRDLRFNASDPTYEKCTLSALAARDTVYLTLAPECATPLLEEQLRGNLLVFGVQPTIVGGREARSTRITIDLSLKTASTVSVRLFTETGEEITRVIKPLPPGRQTLPLELARIPQGVAFLEISDGFEKYVRKVVFE